MGYSYAIKDQAALYYVTFTVHQWADVFTREIYREEIISNLRYCQEKKGLEIYGWVVMSNHIHLILRAVDDNLSDIIRDFKKYTSKAIYRHIKNNPHESRKDWLLLVLSYRGKIWFWAAGYHGEEVLSSAFFYSKLDYIHLNPVRAGIVEKAEDYIYSSAGDFHGIRKGKLLLTEFS